MATSRKLENMREVLLDGRRKFECLVCSRNLTSKRNILQHLHLVHDMSPVKRVKKLYMENKEISVPVRTSNRWKLKERYTIQSLEGHSLETDPERLCSTSSKEPSSTLDDSLRQEQEDNASCSMNYNELETDDDTMSNSDSYASTDLNQAVFSDSEESLLSNSDDCESLDSKLSETDSESSTCCSNENEISVPTSEIEALKIISCLRKHNLTASASKDIIDTVKSIFHDSSKASILNYDYLMSCVGKYRVHEVHYCELCTDIFPDDQDVFRCTTEECEGFRYKGPLSKQQSKDRQPRKCFIVADIEQQFIDLLQSPGVMEDIHKQKMAATSRAEHNDGTITDITDGSAYREILRKSQENNEWTLTALLNTDGVNLYSSSEVELWPIFLAVNELNPKTRFSRQNLLLVGIWQGKGKPPFKSYLKSVGRHFNSLFDRGIDLEFDGDTITVKVHITCGVFDLPAKASVLNMKYFNGEYACITCEEPGRTVKQGKGTARCYPDRQGQYKMRREDEVLASMTLASDKKPIKGLKGVSGLTEIKSLNVVDGIVPDYMHGVLLGITNSLMSKWFSPTNGGKDYFIGKDLKKVSKRLQSIQPPASIERLPRDLEKHYKSLKATELQAWLLFYSIPCLTGILPEVYLSHFSYLSEAIYILLGDNITQTNLQRAQQLLDMFYASFTDLYGLGSCGLNVHNTCAHLVHYVKLWGPLWAWGTFGFEDNNAMLLQAVHGTGNVMKQIMLYKQTQATLRRKSLNVVDSRVWKKTFSASNCDICGKMVPFEMSGVEHALLDKLDADHEQNVKIIGRVSLSGTQFSSSFYTRMKKRVCSYILYDGNKVGNVKYFAIVTTSDTVYAIIDTYETSTDPHFFNLPAGKHILPVKKNGNEIVVAVDRLSETLVYMKVCPDVSECIALMPSRQGHAIFK